MSRLRPPRRTVCPAEPTPLPPERPAPPQQPASAALSTSPVANPQPEPAAPAVTLDLPLPPFPSEPPADLRQPSAFSSAPLP